MEQAASTRSACCKCVWEGRRKRRILLQGTRKAPERVPAHTMCANSLPRALRAATSLNGWVGGRPKSRSPAPIAATGSWKSCACPSAALSQHGDQAREWAYAEHLDLCQRTARRSPATAIIEALASISDGLTNHQQSFNKHEH